MGHEEGHFRFVPYSNARATLRSLKNRCPLELGKYGNQKKTQLFWSEKMTDGQAP